MSDDKFNKDQAIVIDNGSGMIKAGFSESDTPISVFQTVIGRPKEKDSNLEKDYYVGEEILIKKEYLKLKYPLEHGIVTNWEDMKYLWHHCFYDELKINPNEHPILLTDAPQGPKAGFLYYVIY
jgi:actin